MRPELDGRRLVRWQPSPLSVFFPTEKETFLGFIAQGPYRTTPARDNVPEADDWNRALIRQTAILLADVLTELRDQAQLTVDLLGALPIEADRFPAGSMFRPLFDAVRTLLIDGAFIPDGSGGYHQPARLRLAADPGLPGLLTPVQLGELCGPGGPGRLRRRLDHRARHPAAVALPARGGRSRRTDRRSPWSQR